MDWCIKNSVDQESLVLWRTMYKEEEMASWGQVQRDRTSRVEVICPFQRPTDPRCASARSMCEIQPHTSRKSR